MRCEATRRDEMSLFLFLFSFFLGQGDSRRFFISFHSISFRLCSLISFFVFSFSCFRRFVCLVCLSVSDPLYISLGVLSSSSGLDRIG